MDWAALSHYIQKQKRDHDLLLDADAACDMMAGAEAQANAWMAKAEQAKGQVDLAGDDLRTLRDQAEKEHVKAARDFAVQASAARAKYEAEAGSYRETLAVLKNEVVSLERTRTNTAMKAQAEQELAARALAQAFSLRSSPTRS